MTPGITVLPTTGRKIATKTDWKPMTVMIVYRVHDWCQSWVNRGEALSSVWGFCDVNQTVVSHCIRLSRVSNTYILGSLITPLMGAEYVLPLGRERC